MPAPLTSIHDVAELAARVRPSVVRLARSLRRNMHVGLTPSLLSALGTIERHGPMTAGDMAAHEQIQKPTATRLIASLVERNLVARRPDPLDGRVTWLQVTPEGRKLLARARRRSDEVLAKRIRALPPSDIQVLARAADVLERLTEGAE